MKYFCVPQPGGGLVQRECDVPEPGPGQVLVRMRGWSVNFRDLMIAKGLYPKAVKADVVALSDGAGEVVQVGADVTRWSPGDRVVGTYFPRWVSGPGTEDKTSHDLGGTVDGVLAEYVTFSADAVVAVPAHLDFAEAATLPSAGVTAWRAVVEEGRLAPGQNVLTMGSGGVSTFAVQFAALGGARVIATSGSDEKLEKLSAVGAADVINYLTTPAWGAAAAELTAGGVDHVVDVGGAGTIGQSMIAARMGGHISVVGVLTQGTGADPLMVLAKQLTLRGLTNASRETFEEMNQAVERHGLRPVIDKRFAFDEVVSAYRYLESGAHVGKVVLEVD
ncbi:NAD(P)-dependent alcohol dehydrogenase [Planosporangium thailandense]|uniref:NAD(P)-dependent alcohol dehydrogenase n=1 Tax=Planosporangium thailandense TaxID=765197 RepID=A0ABX0XXF6_9ACTN|nr:NAD(P)-dependent alcohol dehydrogenase [Planosporangium thailandense]